MQYERDEGVFHGAPMPNLEALDDELTQRIRRLVHQELAPVLDAKLDEAFERYMRRLHTRTGGRQ